jgi:hypothetical protein
MQYYSASGAVLTCRQASAAAAVTPTLAPRARLGMYARGMGARVFFSYGTAGEAPTPEETTAGGYYDDDPKRAPRKREKLTVIHKDDSDERSQEFEALLARVKGQALDKAKQAAQAAPAITTTADIKPPRMPEIRGVEASLLRQWMPDLLSIYRATFTAELQALASAQQAAAQAQMRVLQRQQYEDEEIAILAMLA